MVDSCKRIVTGLHKIKCCNTKLLFRRSSHNLLVGQYIIILLTLKLKLNIATDDIVY